MAVSFFGENEINYEDLLKLIECESVNELPVATHKGSKDFHEYVKYDCPNCKKESLENEFKEISRIYSVYQCPHCKLYARIY